MLECRENKGQIGVVRTARNERKQTRFLFTTPSQPRREVVTVTITNLFSSSMFFYGGALSDPRHTLASHNNAHQVLL